MKYLFIVSFIFPVFTAVGATNPSPDTENCHYQTEDSHTVNPYSSLLAQITANPEEQRRKKKRKKKKPTGTGQR